MTPRGQIQGPMTCAVNTAPMTKGPMPNSMPCLETFKNSAWEQCHFLLTFKNSVSSCTEDKDLST